MNILLIGAKGKMGRCMQQYLKQHNINYVGVEIDNINEHINSHIDVILDFSLPSAIKQNLKLAQKYNCPIVIATTGHDKDNMKIIIQYSKNIPIFLSENFSILFFLMTRLIRNLKGIQNMDVVVEEKHHKQKVDRPSGSAKKLIKILSLANISPKVHVFRVANVVGEHSVSIFAEDEQLCISHRAQSKMVFCKGAYLACKFIMEKKPKIYGMEDLVDSM